MVYGLPSFGPRFFMTVGCLATAPRPLVGGWASQSGRRPRWNSRAFRSIGSPTPDWRLLCMDAVAIERRHGVATLLLVLVVDCSKPEHRVVNPLWRIELASEEGERIERARHERGANVVRALHQAIFMADASIEQHAMDELRAMVEIDRILIANLKIDCRDLRGAR